MPYRNGMQLAQDEINAKGGVLGGRKLEIVFRDDGSTPGDAVRVAEELIRREMRPEDDARLIGHNIEELGGAAQ